MENNINYKSDIQLYNNRAPLEQRGMLFDKKIWRVKDVAKFLGCSVGHIYNLVSDERIPKVKKGKFVYFIPESVLNWVMEGDLK